MKTYGITVCLVRFQLLMITELYEHGATSELSRARREVCDHG